MSHNVIPNINNYRMRYDSLHLNAQLQSISSSTPETPTSQMTPGIDEVIPNYSHWSLTLRIEFAYQISSRLKRISRW